MGGPGIFSQLILISYLFPIRVPPDPRHLRKEISDGTIAEYVAQLTKALAGVRKIDGSDLLIIKLAWRKNLDGGFILKRPCLRATNSSVGARIFPPNMIWLLVRPESVRANLPPRGTLRAISTVPANSPSKR